MKRLLLAALLLAGFYSPPDAQAQCSGQPGGNTVCASPAAGGSGLPTFRVLNVNDIAQAGITFATPYPANGLPIAVSNGTIAQPLQGSQPGVSIGTTASDTALPVQGVTNGIALNIT